MLSAGVFSCAVKWNDRPLEKSHKGSDAADTAGRDQPAHAPRAGSALPEEWRGRLVARIRAV
jgi:hypothetical protein